MYICLIKFLNKKKDRKNETKLNKQIKNNKLQKKKLLFEHILASDENKLFEISMHLFISFYLFWVFKTVYFLSFSFKYFYATKINTNLNGTETLLF